MSQYQELYGNFGIGFLVDAIGAGDTAMQVSPATAACSFPQLTAGAGQFHVTVSAYDTKGNPTNPEVMLVTANAAGAMTITRAQENTNAAAHAANERVEFGITAAVLRSIAASGGIQTGAGPYTFDGSQNIMEIAAISPAACTVNITTANLVPFRRYTVKDGAGNANTYPITLTPDVGSMDGLPTYSIASNYGACTFYRNGSNIRIVA